MSAQHAQFFFDPAAESNVADGVMYGRGLVGSNDQLSPTDEPPVLDPGAAGLWGLTHPPLSAVAVGVTTPIGVGSAMVLVDPIDPIDPVNPVGPTILCEVVKIDFCAFNGETKTHSFAPIGLDGSPLDLTTETLIATVEHLDNQNDLISAIATYNANTQEVSFDANLEEGNYRWSVRTVDRNIVIGLGEIHVDYAANPGSAALIPHALTVRLNEEPLIGATVRITTDQAGVDLVVELITDSHGKINTSLASGNYYAAFPDHDPDNSHPFSVS